LSCFQIHLQENELRATSSEAVIATEEAFGTRFSVNRKLLVVRRS
jgi:hypothetical protein